MGGMFIGLGLGAALILAAVFAMHHYSAGQIYKSYLTAHWAPLSAGTGTVVDGFHPSFATVSERKKLAEAAQEGVRWSDKLRFEAGVWVVVLLVLLVLAHGAYLGSNYMMNKKK